MYNLNMEECVFCKIVRGEIPCFKIYEDEKHIAFLDIKPCVEGMTVVVTKRHLDSYLFKNDQKTINELIKAAKETSLILEKGLLADRVTLVSEGLDVNHLHVKLYPIHLGSISDIQKPIVPAPTFEELQNLANKINEVSKNI